MATRNLISFDGALKRLLRNKTNFEVLEGFLSELLCRKIIFFQIQSTKNNFFVTFSLYFRIIKYYGNKG